MKGREHNAPLAQKMNVFGRKRYSVETNAADYENFHFDDIWRAIGRLWAAVALLLLAEVFMRNKK